MSHESRTRFLSAIVVAVVFAAGILIGFAVDGSLGAEAAEVTEPAAGSEATEEGERRQPMYSQLQPDPEQQALIDSIIAVHRERTNALDKETRRAYREGFRDILQETRDAIKGVFPADKAAEYQRLLDEFDARREAERQNEQEG